MQMNKIKIVEKSIVDLNSSERIIVDHSGQVEAINHLDSL